jgi:hypothetical protein
MGIGLENVWLLSLVVIGVYGQSLAFHFVDFDDTVLVRNARAKHLADIPHVFASTPSPDTYRPIMFVSVAVNAVLFGRTSSIAYHAVNIALHSVVCCLFVVFALRLGVKRWIALLSGIILAVHPLATQAVAWIPGRNDTLLTLCTLASFLSLSQFILTRSRYAMVFHILCFGCTLLTKETAIVIPLLVAFYLWFLLPQPENRFFTLSICTVEFVVIGLYLFVRSVVPLDGSLRPEAFTRDVIVGVPAIVHTWQFVPESIGKILFPVHLSGYPQYSTSGLIIGGIALLVMVGVGFASWYQARSANKLLSWHLYLFGGVWLLLFLLPPLLRYDSTRDFDYLEHRTY